MAHFDVNEANAWLESTKLTLSSIDDDLEEQVAVHILSRLAGGFTVADWTDDTTTPKLVRSIMAMYYVAWIYDRTYSDDAEDNAYSALLRTTADANIAALLAGTIVLEELPLDTAQGTPSFFPNDASSANPPTEDFPSDGGPAFVMGTTW